jgi:LCP family protein required for cell wall assembly
MRRRLILLFVIFLFILPACQLFAVTSTPDMSQVFTIVAGTLTARAYETPSSEPGTISTPMPLATETPQGSTPDLAASIQQPAGQVTILLMGSDQRPDARDFRTDILLLVVLRPDGSVNLVSFPRDLWVYLPGKFMQRINTAMEYGGFELVQSTFQYNFGFTPQSYVLTNFSGFQSIVDSLGGVDVQVARTFSDARDGYPEGYKVEAGLVHMDGETALWYIRSRKTTDDLDRLRRSQEVISAIGKKLLSLDGLAHVPEFYSALRSAVGTDLTLQDLVALVPALQSVDTNRIQRYSISSDQLIPYVTSGGADVFLPRQDAIRQVLEQALGN